MVVELKWFLLWIPAIVIRGCVVSGYSFDLELRAICILQGNFYKHSKG